MEQTLTMDPTFWDNLAEKYAAKPVDLPEAFERKIAITKALITPESVVLDVGSGTGSLALRLAEEAHHVVGLDFSAEMTRIANEKADAQGARNVTFHCGTLEGLTRFEPGSLDGICAYSLLHLVHDRPATLARIYALLKPGGFFVSSTVCMGEGLSPYHFILPIMRLVGKAPYVAIIGHERLEGEIRNAGFVELTKPDVGAKARTAFIVARKPAA